TLHSGSVPLHPAPTKPRKTESAPSIALSCTVLPLAKEALQLPGQSMPAGALMTRPVPVLAPASTSTLSRRVAAAGSNSASTCCTPEATSSQGPTPSQAPDQPRNTLPDCAAAVST